MPEEGEDGTVSEDVTEKLSSVDMVEDKMLWSSDAVC
jgi:hypothetical protein